MRYPLLTIALVAACSGPEPDTRPNVLIVMADDQGYGDFSGIGNAVVETPRLDAFATQCPQVARFYVSPVCAPTRAALMTGRYNYRTRVVDTWVGRAQMEPDEFTLAEALRDVGYHTGIFGKWHLGDAYPMRALDQGFDVACVHRGGGLAQPSEPPVNERRYTDAMLERNGTWFRSRGYCTDVYVDEALEFIEDRVEAGEPFFAYVATNAPHGPFHDVPQDLYEKYRERDMGAVRKPNGTDPDILARTFAMIENIDQNFGRLLDRLDGLGIADNTIVVFLCDNGPVRGRWVAGLRGGKTDVYEGGIRSPLWVRWPGRLSAETKVERIGAHIDLMPTLLEATETPAPAGVALDGRSLLPLLEGRQVDWPERHIIIQSHRGDVPERDHNCAIIGQRWKLVRASGFGEKGAYSNAPWQLFDLANDRSETDNRIAQEMKRVVEMRTLYDNWFADVSATREDNYDAPRIRPGTAHELRTTLTWQDWRYEGGPGWGTLGRWLLHMEEPQELALTLLFKEERTIETVDVLLDGDVHTLAVHATGNVIQIGAVAFAVGDVDLQIVCRNGEESFDAYQVVLQPAQ